MTIDEKTERLLSNVHNIEVNESILERHYGPIPKDNTVEGVYMTYDKCPITGEVFDPDYYQPSKNPKFVYDVNRFNNVYEE